MTEPPKVDGRTVQDLKPDYEGALDMEIGVKDGQVVLHLGRPMEWLSLPSAQARKLGQMIIEFADKADAQFVIERVGKAEE